MMKKILLTTCLLLITASAKAYNEETEEIYNNIIEYFKQGLAPWGDDEQVKDIIQYEHGSGKNFYNIFNVVDVISGKALACNPDENLNMDFGVYKLNFFSMEDDCFYMMLIYKHEVWFYIGSSRFFTRRLFKIKNADDGLISDSDMLKILRANFFEDEIEYKRDFEYFNRHELMFREIGNVRYLPSDD
ncbi:MAG: hypothetical protein SOU49_09380 [Sodaliphilus pleomorphus]|uniref:hypothetical protein n=1 Tax=Sodaliphilus pleomorphus TaxID=2606626 RepID=UPI0023F0D16C|nr:hypothetical protein [Sodaliphilus pleomorphus]MDD7065403.1 hypothetical protein [Sodaliphilus pleomorphus]MDY2832938.1 hypothetical protein [Sodaliphilus pleomorphus]